mmetsp:Transcript_356/g.956  ORF Transcript_356/g.956 Transcript_356/m.956 type:complete len:325 (+) Transcript_356:31-1005(+)
MGDGSILGLSRCAVPWRRCCCQGALLGALLAGICAIGVVGRFDSVRANEKEAGFLQLDVRLSGLLAEPFQRSQGGAGGKSFHKRSNWTVAPAHDTSDLRLLVFMTTVWSAEHLEYLPCWANASRRFRLLHNADLLVHAGGDAGPSQEELEEMLHFRKVTVTRVDNPGYQSGAFASVNDGFGQNSSWFNGYDWIMRVNPDVLILREDWLLTQLSNTSIDGILCDCNRARSVRRSLLHTDFFLVRPLAVNQSAVAFATKTQRHAEHHLTQSFWSILKSKRYVWLKNDRHKIHQCRVKSSEVVHGTTKRHRCQKYHDSPQKVRGSTR